MEQIPEIRENEFGIYISRRYQGGFEVSVSYTGSYIRRYPLSDMTDRFLSYIVKHVPVLGLWLFNKEKRMEMVKQSYTAAVQDFIQQFKLDIADSIINQEGPNE
jgi:hypothetical protein